jgi:hypothetical protein
MRLQDHAPAAPIALWTVAVWLTWGWLGGGHAPDRWGFFGAVLLGALAVGVVTTPPLRERLRGARLVVAGGFTAFVAWNFLSLLWADFPGDAWIGSDKSVLYLATFLAFALWPWSTTALFAALGVFALGVTGLGAAEAIRVLSSSDLSAQFPDSRLAAPIGYVDGNAALWTLGFWPAVFLGSTRAAPAALRPIFLASATFLLGLAITIQSRGWLAACSLTAVLFIVLARQRLRLLLGTALAAGGALAVIRPLLDVYERGRAGGSLEAAFAHAVGLLLVGCGAVAVAGTVWCLADLRLRLSRRAVRTLGAIVAALCISAVVAASAWATHRVSHPGRWVSDRWAEFRCPYCPNPNHTESRFAASVSGDRYREWQVAWRDFERHPLLGVGADNYAASYLERRTDPFFQPKYPHSIPLRLLSQLGTVGTLLFVVPFVVAVGLALRLRRRLDPVAGGGVAAALTIVAYWLVHGSIDWFWEIPALAAPAFGFLGLAGAVEPDVRASDRPTIGVGRIVVAAGCAAAIVAVVLPGLSYALVRSAGSDARTSPTRAYHRLTIAADLNPLSADAPLAAGSIALRHHEWPRAARSLADAAGREPKNWFVYVQLALLADNRQRYAAAMREIRQARRLNPQDPEAAVLERAITRRFVIEPNAFGNLYLAAARRRFG